MEKETVNQRNRNIGFIIIICSLLIVVFGLVAYFFYSSEYKVINKQTTNQEELEEKKGKDDDKEEKSNQITTRGFDSTKCVDDNSNNFSLVTSDDATYFSLNKENNIVELTVYWDNIKEGWGIEPQQQSNYIINNFNGQVVDVYSGLIGQDATGEVAVFLLEDGSVEYIPLYNALKTQNIKSYGKINGVEDVVKFYSAVASPKDSPVGSYTTILAQKKDGTFYNLGEKLRNHLG